MKTMKNMERVIIHHSITYDFLASIYRLNNNDFLLKLFNEISAENAYVPDPRIQEWVTETREKLPENIVELMNRYFDWQAPFGMRYLSLIASGGSERIEDLILFLYNIPERDLIRDFLLLSFGPRAVKVDEKELDSILDDEERLMVFLSKKMALKMEHKVMVLEFFTNPARMKEDLIYLLEWYQENIFRKRIPYVERTLKGSIEELSSNLEKYGEPYLMRLIENMDYSEAASDRRIVLSISYYVENLSASIFHPLAKNDLFFIGYRYIRSTLNNLFNDDSSRVFRALADDRRLEMLRLIAGKRLTGYELTQEMSLSGSEVTECFTVLLDAGLIRTSRTEEGIYFSTSMDNVRSRVLDSLDR